MFVALLMAAAVQSAPVADVAPAAATAPAAAAASATAERAAVKADDDGVVCRSEAVTGTRFAHRICRRKSEMEASRRATQEQIRMEQRDFGPHQ
jgi:hypothetical protein